MSQEAIDARRGTMETLFTMRQAVSTEGDVSEPPGGRLLLTAKEAAAMLSLGRSAVVGAVRIAPRAAVGERG